MNLIKLTRHIFNHPLNRKSRINSIIRFFRWQISQIIMPLPVIYQYTNRSKLIMKKGMAGATQNLYCGLHEFNEMFFTLHFLRKEDLFVDIGSNVGSYTVLASAHIMAQTIAIEPVPSTYDILLQNISINQIQDRVIPLNIALGARRDSIAFTRTLDTMNHIAIGSDKDIILVNVDTLDKILENQAKPSLLKIDVEGYETEVIKGALLTIADSNLKAIIIELNGSGKRYGYDEIELHELLLSFSFNSFSYDPFDRKLEPVNCFGKNNTIYIRDIDFVKDRLMTAEKVEILTFDV